MKKNKRVCILAPVHRFDDIRVFQKEAITLSERGYEVILIARKEDDQEVRNIKVIGVPKYKNRLQRLIIQPWLLRQVLSSKARLIHLHNPDTLLIGFLLKLLGKTVIYDTHEDFSKRILIRKWIPKGLRQVLAYLVGSLERLAGYTLDATISTQEEVSKRIGRNSVVIENAPLVNSTLIQNAYRISKSIKKEDVFRLVYVGGISKERGLLQVIEALETLNKKGLEVRLWLIGPKGNEDISEASQLSGWKYVDYLGYLPQDEAFAYMIQSNIGIVTILDVGDHRNTSPNKIYEYQRFGLPFIASSFEKWEKQLREINSGLFVDPQSVSEIVSAVEYLFNNKNVRISMGMRGQKFISETFNWEKESKKLIDMYADLTDK